VQRLAVDHRRHADARVAHDAVDDRERLTRERPLRDVVERELVDAEGGRLVAAPRDQQVILRIEVRVAQRLGVRDDEAGEGVALAEEGLHFAARRLQRVRRHREAGTSGKREERQEEGQPTQSRPSTVHGGGRYNPRAAAARRARSTRSGTSFPW
jgi:hypothetical protein